jgi:HD-like signal output (HDOD) protein
MLKGTLAKFSPGDLLSVLSHLNQEGVLSVSHQDEGLNIFFRGGLLVAAHSEQADTKVLAGLLAKGLITASQGDALDRARRETGLPLRQLLEDTAEIDVASVAPLIETGIREVVFQLFAWETGEFQFNEMPVAESVTGPGFACTGLVMDAARQIDEYREFMRRIASEDRVPALAPAGRAVRDGGGPGSGLLARIDGRATVRQLVQRSPDTSFEAMKALDGALQAGWIRLRLSAGAAAGPVGGPATESGLFLAYKRSSQKVMQATDRQGRIAELIAYCRGQFDYFLLLSFEQAGLSRCVRFCRDAAGEHQGVELPGAAALLPDDPAFRYVRESQAPFFGEAFSSPLLRGLGEPDPPGECAIIPLGGKGDNSYLLFVSANPEDRVPGPLHYLEMIAWQIHAPARAQAPAAEAAPPPAVAAAVVEVNAAAADMIAAVNELPPMPQVVSRVMELLSDPNTQLSNVVQVISHDPTLVARLIRVSNSALYRRGTETSSLGQAVVRLGANAVRSLVMAASLKSLFPVDRTSVGLWGQSLWRHSIESALAARRVAQLVNYPDPEEAFVAGALHDIGRVAILLHRTDEFRAILKQQAKWNMPANLRACVRHHHDLACDGSARRLVLLAAAGNHLSGRYGSEPVDPADPGAFDAIWAELGFDATRLASLVGEIGASLEHGGLLD